MGLRIVAIIVSKGNDISSNKNSTRIILEIMVVVKVSWSVQSRCQLASDSNMNYDCSGVLRD